MPASTLPVIRKHFRDQPVVETALNILRKIKVPTKKYERPSGIFGHASYYGRELFYLLFMNAPSSDQLSSSRFTKKNGKLVEAIRLLEGAARKNNSDATFLLAEMNFYGNYTHPRDFSKAFQYYDSLAALTGNSTAQYMLGFMYATGIGGVLERDQGKALLFHTFAATGGNTRSQMTLAYRRYVGIGATPDCDQAVYWYKKVADKAIKWYRSGPPGGITMRREAFRWADDEGGVYGEGASVSSAGYNAMRDVHSSADASLDDVLEYLDLMAKKGDTKATFGLGKLYYEGSRQLERSYKKAMMYFVVVARKYWTKDGSINPSHPPGIDKIAAQSAAHIGLMFLRGEGTERNYQKAKVWFTRGRANGDSMCQHYLGLMYLHGYGVEQDVMMAASYFKAAAEQDNHYSKTQLGALFLDQGDVVTASIYFEAAARHGGMEALYYLAGIADRGLGGQRHCGVATAYYKMVSEKAEGIHSAFSEANDAYEIGDKELALIISTMAAEQGYESAQANVAYLLDEKRSVLSLDPILPWVRGGRSSLLRNAALGFIYWARSAKQANVDSMVKLGDYYFEGYGTKKDVSRALTCYHSAAEGHSAQAFWNLGWMYENGLHVEQDFPMAKRYYDLALETNQEAYFPVTLSLLRLRARNFWNKVIRGKANTINAEPDINTPRTFKEWISHFINYNEEEEAYQRALRQQAAADPDAILDDAGNAHAQDQDLNYYDEDALDFDDGILESLIIIGLVATLVLLLHFRQQRAARRAQEANNANNQQQNQGADGAGNAAGDRGFFPQPDDPNFAAWVAGGLGR
ncbi:SEL1L [Nannizzia gypsea CBS 118893]|uniref:SEL1L n=1 Tax=Arthroderma gypseum (strain ATCC MYA-4604 / CBS 118893) TaxID=535722 RepID=E4V1N0_ARTGP|nr:SEL1L [Nannizzia gypsea CBS 118893]EFR03945.1 SEL1L [Nannizzia gypsea CBS 118893]